MGGGGGGVGVALGPPNGGAGGCMAMFCWLGKGEVIVFESGVLLLAVGGFTTIGVSFHWAMSFALEGGGTEGVAFCGGGAPKAGAGAP